ncbi:MAG: hypothetical protein KatS3mg131_0066 [Candidatus Tectimicrobiota bacterium]|nr:MAG: hypothetical protein KatS3mg131_0066 [Candidatus Tectomicrobia bacterium]
MLVEAQHEPSLRAGQGPGAGLEGWHFTQIAAGGFGDPLNAYAHTMAWFQGQLYVGTTRANLCLLKARMPIPVHCWPVKCPQDVYDLDLRAQIWRYHPEAKRWQQVHCAPRIVGRSGELVPREIGFRGMAVFQGEREQAPALYVATWAPSRGRGPLILRSTDGEEFVPVSEPGLGDPTVSVFRALVPFNGRLYVAPTGRAGGKANTPDNPVVLESSEPAKGLWRLAAVPGFGDPNNLTVFEMAVFHDHLYAGTLNPKEGYQIWKTRAQGTPPYRWTKVLSHGAYRGPCNEAVVSMCVFNDALYVGSGIQNGGYDRVHQVGPAAPELIRLYPDDSWELIVGEERQTPHGFKYPLSGFGPGFDSIFNGYFWRMAVHEGCLYLGTFNWAILLPYLQPLQPGSRGERLVRLMGIDALVQFEGGFDLFRSTDGVHWAPVSTNGLGNPYNFGARTLVSTPYGLFLGTANPFGPEVAVRTPIGWLYAQNPKGGAEVWLGSAQGQGSDAEHHV